jgi:hypothetical protein
LVKKNNIANCLNTESINSYLREVKETVSEVISKVKPLKTEQVIINSSKEIIEGTFFNKLLKILKTLLIS